MGITADWLKTRAEIEFIYSPYEEEVRGNAIASGDEGLDEQYENDILGRLDGGDMFAWFSVECRATFEGVSESDYLGACTYDDAASFERDAYADDMRHAALEGLARTLNKIRAATD